MLTLRALPLLLLAACGPKIPPGLAPHYDLPETERAPASAEVRGWYLRARVAEERGDLEEAERALRWVVRLDPEPAARVAWGRFLARTGRPADALPELQEAVARGPEHPDAWLALGQVLVVLGDDEQAEDALDHAARLGADWEAHYLLVRLHQRADDLPDARAALLRWQEGAASSTAEALRRGRVALDLGEDALAVDDLLQALRDPEVHVTVGDLLVEAAVRACRIGPVWGWADGSALEMRAGWGAIAQRIEEEARAPDLDRCHVEEILADARLATGPERIALLERAVDAAPLSLDVLDALAAAYHEEGMNDRALRILDRALRVQRTDERLRLLRAWGG